MLNFQEAPNICRFLIELSMDRRPILLPFDWGVARSAPFLPRIASENLVLSPAQWHIQRSTIAPCPDDEDADETNWFAQVQKWREKWRVPRYVYLTDADNRLLLDLEHPLMVAELRTEAAKLQPSGFLKLQEMLPDFDNLWLRNNDAPYLAEFVVPLMRSIVPKSAAVAPLPALTVDRSAVTYKERRRTPGNEWVYLKLYAEPQEQEAILAGSLLAQVTAMMVEGLIDRWFFIRYVDPEPHLRLRFHCASQGSNSSYHQLLARAISLANELENKGMLRRMCIDTYEREIERYGGILAIDTLEEIFSVSSSVTCRLIAAQYQHQLTLDSTAVAVFSLDRFFDAWGYNADMRLARLNRIIKPLQFREHFRRQRKLLCELIASSKYTYTPEVQKQKEVLFSLTKDSEVLLRKLAAQVRQMASQGRFLGNEDSLLDSLAHMHVNRLIGVGNESESKVYALWRHTLDSIHRRKNSTES
jgi:thiopeptide-type bacteriocin biosynthesis protein